MRDATRDFVTRLFIYTNTLADTNVAQHVDVDGFRRNAQNKPLTNEDAYMQSISRARLLVRRLEATTQALYDGGGMLLLAAQLPLHMSASIIPAISALTDHIGSSVEIIEDLYTVGHEQATLASEDQVDFDYRGSISWRMSRLSMINAFDGSAIDSMTMLLNSDDSANASRDALTEDGEEMVGMEEAFSRGPRAGSNALATGGSIGESLAKSGTMSLESDARTRSGSKAESVNTLATRAGYDSESITTVTNPNNEGRSTGVNADLPDDDDEDRK